MVGWIAREAPIVDPDLEDAGQDRERAKDDGARLLRRAVGHPVLHFGASELRIDQISRSAQTGATWFFHACLSVMKYEGFDIGGCLDRSQLSANISTGTRQGAGSMYSPFEFDIVNMER